MPSPQDPPEPIPPELGKTVVAIGLAAHFLGLFCLYDALREGLGAYQFHTAIPMLSIYKGVLGIYTAARQGHQWSDPDAKPSFGGRFFVLAWVGLYVVLNALEVGRLWNPPPIQPVELDQTLTWVLGFYVFGKASTLARMAGYRPLGLGKALDARRAARLSLAPTPAGVPEDKRKMMAALGLAADVLGGICLFDVLRETVTPPNQSFVHIHFAYRLVLAAYAGTNQWRKWTDPQADSPRSGIRWVAAWLGALVLLKGLELISSENLIVMPQHLAGTLLCVFSIYGLGRTSDLVRKGGLRLPGLGTGRQAGPAPRPVEPALPPDPGDQQPPDQGSPEPPESADDSEDRTSRLERVAAACEEAGDFNPSDIVAATGLTVDTVKHWIKVLVRKGWVDRIEHGRYCWKGRGADA